MSKLKPTKSEIKDFREFMFRFARDTWGYNEYNAQTIADTSVRNRDHYFAIYLGGRRSKQ